MFKILTLLLSISFFESKKNKLINKIDSIIEYSIKEKAFPGAQILVLKDGEEVINKNYGYHTYDSLIKVSRNSIYDLASITKPTAGAIALMKLHENNLLDLNKPLSHYIKFFNKSRVGDVLIKDYLQHISGIRPWIPFHSTTKKDDGQFKRKTLSYKQKRRYKIKLTDDLYLFNNFKKEIYNQIKKTYFVDSDTVLYSGLFFYLIPEIVEMQTNQTFDKYVENLFSSMNLDSILFNPTKKIDLKKIVPTEDDDFFRNFQIHGFVHDEGAAMMDGVSGNAGLFSNASDLSKIYQMFLDDGFINDKKFMDKKVIELFTQYSNENEKFYRGLGFDKPKPVYDIDKCTYSKYSSGLSFGHSGYTGTFFWVDPKYNLIYVFLSNRVYDTRENRKIYELNVRTKIHDLIYENLIKIN